MSHQSRPPQMASETILDAETGKPAPVVFSRTWLAAHSKEELIDYVVELAGRLKVDPFELEETTIEVAPLITQLAEPTSPPPANTSPDPLISRFARLPKQPVRSPAEIAQTTWRIILTRTGSVAQSMGIEIVDDVVMGRITTGVQLDLDLTPLDAERLGISRTHALLKPTRDQLLLCDLGSTNGTYYNGQPVSIGSPRAVEDGAVIRLGGLSLSVKIVCRPGDIARSGAP